MHVFGIIAEYNPFHSGHQYHIEEIKRRYGEDCSIVCVMSGNWVQRGDSAICDKWSRAHMALHGGADLIIELPTLWATASAEHFADGAVSILVDTGLIDSISFGSECGDISILEQTATCLLSDDYKVTLRDYLSNGLSFPSARQKAVSDHFGDIADCLQSANNTLGVEYIKAIQTRNAPIASSTIKREGVAHDSLNPSSHFASASFIRQQLLSGHSDEVTSYVSKQNLGILLNEGLSSLSYCTRGVFSRLRSMDKESFLALPDSGEGLHNLLHTSAMQAKSLDELYMLIKSKRYTHARIRRLVLWAYLGLKEADRPKKPPYLRILGMNEKGQSLLKQMKKTASIPIITKAAHIKQLGDESRRVFELEVRSTALYDLCRANFETTPAKSEYTQNPILYHK